MTEDKVSVNRETILKLLLQVENALGTIERLKNEIKTKK